MKHFLLVRNEIKKRDSYNSLFDRKIIDNCISNSLNANSFFDAKKKNDNDIIVFNVEKHVNVWKSTIVMSNVMK